MKTRKSLVSLLMMVMILALVTVGCGQKDTPADEGNKQQSEEKKPLKVALIINGTLGDKGFFDSANRGIEEAKKEFGIEAKVVEAGNEPSEWEPALRAAAAEGQYDLIITGTYQMLDHVKNIAPEFPDQKFIVFDVDIKGIPNVYSILYSQSEGSFLAGALAGLVTTSNMELANPEKKIGFLGGMDIPIINDFLAGYEQGAKYIDPEIQVLKGYVGNFFDAAKGKELTMSQYAQGVDIAFNVAGGAGLGLLEAAKVSNKYAIGVDSNQNGIYPGFILSSMLKNVDVSLVRAIQLHLEGKLPYGDSEVIGIKEGAVGLAKDSLYEQYVPQEIRDKLEEIEGKIRNGEIKVNSVLTGSN
ncbi:BMP family lipoprotein [Zhaonella formicivorans]|uniref:BMP family lipoprotein n=1 Tax=Zhaonella formicivorans TaxID=2528593 RepID=UPI001D1088E7|nr:BMP family ABC transporter substrate-binding protein [Zhaonella formicivorans]